MNLKDLAKGFILIGAFFLVSCSENESKEITKHLKYVKIEKVSSQNANQELIFNANIKEKSLNMLSFRVGGPMTQLNVQAGEFVQKGQVIAQIDKRDYETQLATRRAQYEQIKAEYERYQELHDKSKIPDNSYEKVKSGYLMAKAAYENAVHQLEDTELKAPFSGYIHEKMSENYQTVGPGQPIVSMIDKSVLEMQISVPENQISNINKEGLSLINIKNANIKNHPIQLVNISNKTGKDGLYKIKYLIEGEVCTNILPGMSSEVIIQSPETSQLTSIPSSAVFNKNKQNYVWLYNSNSKNITQKQIKINGFLSDGNIEVIDGLKQGDSVVTSGVSSLFEGELVEPIKPASATNIGGLL
jgi:RND family efflux transporter MFP subunit